MSAEIPEKISMANSMNEKKALTKNQKRREKAKRLKYMRRFEGCMYDWCRHEETCILAFDDDYKGVLLGIGEWTCKFQPEKDIFIVQIQVLFCDEKAGGLCMIQEETKEGDCMEYIPEEIDDYLKKNCYGKKFTWSELVPIIQKIFEFVEKERGYRYVYTEI